MIDVVSRSEWGAKTPPSAREMRLPARITFIHHSVTPSGGGDPKHERDLIRMIEAVHVKRFGVGPGYSFLIGATGRVYEGQGWTRRGAHTENYNSIAHGICFLGTFSETDPTDAAIEAASILIREGRALGHITPTSIVLPHRAVKQTACPGQNLYTRIDDIQRLANSGGGARPPQPPNTLLTRNRATPQGDEVLYYRITGDPTKALYVRNPDGVVNKVDGLADNDPNLPLIIDVSKDVHDGYLWVHQLYVQGLQKYLGG